VLAAAAFVVDQRRSPAAMVPPSAVADRVFVATNVVTVLVYAALGGIFFLLVLHLQVVAGFSAIAAGTALLPVTVVMLLLSGRAGALAGRIGPRLPMAAGPLLAAVGVLGMLRVGTDASWLVDVAPPVTVLGLGLALTVAPLTATVLGAVEDRYAGVASGVNNAVARTGQLLAVAALPLVVGLSGSDYADPAQMAPAFRTSMVICAALLAAGGLVAAATVPGRPLRPARPAEERAATDHQCALTGTPMQPPHAGEAEPTRPGPLEST
jgi:MFS family permease